MGRAFAPAEAFFQSYAETLRQEALARSLEIDELLREVALGVMDDMKRSLEGLPQRERERILADLGAALLRRHLKLPALIERLLLKSAERTILSLKHLRRKLIRLLIGFFRTFLRSEAWTSLYAARLEGLTHRDLRQLLRRGFLHYIRYKRDPKRVYYARYLVPREEVKLLAESKAKLMLRGAPLYDHFEEESRLCRYMTSSAQKDT